MTNPDQPPVLDAAALRAWVTDLAAGTRRCLVGITGPPGVGKSSVAEWLGRELDGSMPVVAMDGFHLAQAVLDEAGTADRKGAPHTFDVAGFVALLRRLRDQPADEVVYAPRFDRHLEEPIAGAVPVHPTDHVVLVEGNYLLLDEPPWDEVRRLLDGCIHLDLDPAVRVERLIARHVEHGRSPEAAREWVRRSDERNAGLIDGARHRADVALDCDSLARARPR